MRGLMAVIAFALLFVGICSLGQGAFDVGLDERGGGRSCYNRDGPSAALPETVSPRNGTWPLGLACVWTMSDGSEYVDQPDWSSTWLVYGGGALLVAGSAATVGVCLAYRRASAAEVRRKR